MDVPAGTLPPGAAEAEIVAGPSGFTGSRERFAMPAQGGTTLRMWFQWGRGEQEHDSIVVELRGARGSTRRERVPLKTVRERAQSPTSSLFLGDAARLGLFVDAVRARAGSPTDEQGVTSGIRLDTSAAAVARGCRAVSRAAVVIADGPAGALPALMRCAAQGARVVIVDPAAAPPLSSLPQGHAVPWGAGLLSWAPTFDVAAAAALDATSSEPDAPRQFAGRVSNALVYQGWMSERDEPAGASQAVVLVLIAGYVLVLGPLGWFVLRRRNTVLSWVYFPAVAIVATLLLGVITLGSDGKADRLRLDRSVMSSPTGDGLEVTALRVLGVQTRTYAIRAPWRDADLVQMGRPFRFGSPFTEPAGVQEVVHDAARGTVAISGIGVSRWSEAGISWAQPQRVAVPHLASAAAGGALDFVAATDAPTRVALVCTADGWALLQDLAAGERRPVRLVPAEELRERLEKLGGRWQSLADIYGWGAMPPPGRTVLLATEPRVGPDRAFRVTPAVPVEERTLHVVVGVLP